MTRIIGGGRLEKITILSSLSLDDRHEATACGSGTQAEKLDDTDNVQCFTVQDMALC
jgi:hypothetical protein